MQSNATMSSKEATTISTLDAAKDDSKSTGIVNDSKPQDPQAPIASSSTPTTTSPATSGATETPKTIEGQEQSGSVSDDDAKNGVDSKQSAMTTSGSAGTFDASNTSDTVSTTTKHEEEPPELRVGFIGGGKMAFAIASGFVKENLVKSENIMASDTSGSAATTFGSILRAKTTTCNKDIMEFCDVVFISVKPNVVPHVLKADVKPHLNIEKHVIVSVAAGVSLQVMAECLENDRARLVRVMPNTPALVGASASAFSVKPSAYAEQDSKVIEKLLSAIGIAAKVEEKYLDAVTGVSGSGPAYIYMAIEAMSDGGVAAGLPRELATKFAAQTVFGAAKMVLETGMHPGVLKDMVASPGGTTIEAIHQLEKGNLRATMINAVRAASDKSKQFAEAAKK